MLRDADAVTMLAVKDLGKAAQFYEKTLGLNRAGAEGHEAITFESGDTTINVYRSSRREGDVHVSGDIKVAWFKDPDGNILSVVNR